MRSVCLAMKMLTTLTDFSPDLLINSPALNSRRTDNPPLGVAPPEACGVQATT